MSKNTKSSLSGLYQNSFIYSLYNFDNSLIATEISQKIIQYFFIFS